MEHRNRILERILKPNFIGAIVCSKDILPTKIQLFDVTADVSINNVNETDSIVIMNYGDYEYNFKLGFTKRESEHNVSYIVSTIK